MGQRLTTEQELIIAVLATARSQGVEILFTLETYYILTRILRYPIIAKAIIANTGVICPSKPFKQWLRKVRQSTTLTREDAKILAYATFGTNLSGTSLGCEKVLTLDSGFANEFEARKDKLEKKLSELKNRLGSPYQKAGLPQVVLLDID